MPRDGATIFADLKVRSDTGRLRPVRALRVVAFRIQINMRPQVI